MFCKRERPILMAQFPNAPNNEARCGMLRAFGYTEAFAYRKAKPLWAAGVPQAW
jgi:hypothetical protein